MASVRHGIGRGDARTYQKFFLHDNTITYDATLANGSASIGLAVTTTSRAADTVGLVGDAEYVDGRLEQVYDDGTCSVTVWGEVELPGGASATLTEGTAFYGDLGASSAEGYIQTGAAGSDAQVQAARGRIWNSDTATAVRVFLN